MRTLAVIASKSFTDVQGRSHSRGDVFSLPIVDALKALKRRDVKPAPKYRAAAPIPPTPEPVPIVPEPIPEPVTDVVVPEPETSEDVAESEPLQPESPVTEDAPRRKRAYRRRDLTPEA